MKKKILLIALMGILVGMGWSCGTKGGDIESPADERAALLEELAASEAALLDSNVVKGSPEYEALLRHDDSLLFLIYGETLEEDL